MSNDEIEKSNSWHYQRLEQLPPDTEEEKVQTTKLLIKYISNLLKPDPLPPLKSLSLDSRQELASTYTKLKRSITTGKKIKRIKFGFFTTLEDGTIYESVSVEGKLRPELIFKNFSEYNLNDALLLGIGGKDVISDDNRSQLSSALTIINSLIIKQFQGNDVNGNTNIQEALEKIFANKNLQSVAHIKLLNDLKIANDYFKEYESIEEHLSEYDELNIPPDTSIFALKPVLHDFDELYKEDLPQTLGGLIEEYKNSRYLTYISSIDSLDKAVNQAIDLGFLDKFKSKNRKNVTPPLCTEHSFLNNRRLLRRLDSNELNYNGNIQKKNINTRLRNEIKKNLIAYLDSEGTQKLPKSIPKMAEKLSQILLSSIEEIIENDKANYKHSISIKSENLAPLIEKIIREDKEIRGRIT